MFFAEYAEADSGMTSDQLVTFAADCELLTPRLTKARVTLVFDQLKADGETSINFALFQEAIREIAILREEKLVVLVKTIEADFVRARVIRICERLEGAGNGSPKMVQPDRSQTDLSKDVPHVTIFTKYGDGTTRHPVFRNSVYVKEIFVSMGFSVYNPNTDNPSWKWGTETDPHKDTVGQASWLLSFNQSIARSKRTRGLVMLLEYEEAEMSSTIGTMSEEQSAALRGIPRVGVPVYECIEYTPSLAKKHCLLVRAAARRQWEGCGVDALVVQLTTKGGYTGEHNAAGQYHGTGTYEWAAGARYEGGYREGKKHGNGKFYYANGERYEGEWREGERHGEGSYYYPNGSNYEGRYRGDKKNGQGILYARSGAREEGKYENDTQIGVHTLYDAGGKVAGSKDYDKLVAGGGAEGEGGQRTQSSAGDSKHSGVKAAKITRAERKMESENRARDAGSLQRSGWDVGAGATVYGEFEDKEGIWTVAASESEDESETEDARGSESVQNLSHRVMPQSKSLQEMHKEEELEELAKLGMAKVKVAPPKVKAKVMAKQAKGLKRMSRAQRKHESEQRAQMHRVATAYGEFSEEPADGQSDEDQEEAGANNNLFG
jgi:hypothetical protein